MDYKLIWSPQAIEDIQAIAEYIGRDSSIYAESTVERIFQAPEKLIQFPKLGRVVPEFATTASCDLAMTLIDVLVFTIVFTIFSP